MFHSPRALALRAVAVVVAVLTARTVALDLRAIHAQAHSLGPVRAVVVARHTLLKGDIVVRDDVGVVNRHLSQQPAGTINMLDRVVGHAITIDVATGAPVLRANVAAARTTSGALASDERAVRVVDAGGLVPEVGAIVDVYATFDGSTGARATTDLVARGARVLRVDRQSSDLPTAHGATGASGILLMVRASDTADVASAVANAIVTVAIAPVEDACCVDP